MRKRFINSEFKAVIANIIETIQRLFTKTSHKFLCHFEFVSEFHEVKIPHQPLSKQFTELFCSAEWDDIKGQIFKPFKHLTIRKAFAFTLAETLIVMGIIGVVAALTIPNLNSSTANKEKVAKVKKVYQNLTDAYGRMNAVYGRIDEWTTHNSTIFGDRLSEFMKTSKNCGLTRNTGGTCWTNSNTMFANNTAFQNIDSNSFYKFVLADGTTVAIGATTLGVNIYVDIDGPRRGPNKFGTDIFQFQAFYNSTATDTDLKPAGLTEFANSTAFASSTCFTEGNGCTMWVITNDNMDYLKADNTAKCPNGKILNWTTNTSCK